MKDSSSQCGRSGTSRTGVLLLVDRSVFPVGETVQEIRGVCFKAFIGLISGRWV